jgi:polar amino acid transport system substrate-binding protein
MECTMNDTTSIISTAPTTLKIIPRYFSNLLMLIMACFLCFPVAAESSTRPILTIGFSDIDSYPNEYLENGKLVGFHIEMITTVAHELGYDINAVRMPMKRLLKMNRRGKLDGVVYGHDASVTNDDFHFYSGSTVYGNGLSVNSYFLMIKKSRKDIRFHGDFSSLENLSIGIIRGFNLINYGDFDAIFDGLKVFEADSQKQLDILLERGRIDAAIVPLTFFHRYKNGNLKDFKVLSRPLITDHSNLAFSKKKIAMEFVVKFSDQLVSYQNTSHYIKRLKYYNQLRAAPRDGEM